LVHQEPENAHSVCSIHKHNITRRSIQTRNSTRLMRNMKAHTAYVAYRNITSQNSQRQASRKLGHGTRGETDLAGPRDLDGR
jgi:hypothetical protein